MIATIATWLIARNPAMTLGAARRLAKIGLAVAVVLAIAGGAALWLHFHDAGVIERHETRAKLEEATTALESERRATTAGAVRDQARAAAAVQSSDAMKEAEDADPEAAQAPAGPVSRAAARRFPVRS